MNLLYLHYRHGAGAGAGMGRIAGTRLYSQLRAAAAFAPTAHMIVDDRDFRDAVSSYRDDVLPESEVWSEGFDTIYCEGGPRSEFGSDGAWVPKVPYPLADKFVRQGGILVFSDVDTNFAAGPDAPFCELSSAWFSGPSGCPIYFADHANTSDPFRLEIDLLRVKPIVAEWLQPVFDAPGTLTVHGAVELRSVQSLLLCPTQESVGSLCNDLWWAAPQKGVDSFGLRYHPEGHRGPDFMLGPFACVRQLGLGFVVTIAAIVSSDRVSEAGKGPGRFLTRLITHLRDCVRREKETAGFQRFRDTRLFLSHRSTDKGTVEAVAKLLKRGGIRTWFDKDHLLPSDSVGLSIDGGLQESTHFTLFWSANCVGAPWINFELGAALTACVEDRKPILIVPLDNTPVPRSLAQYLRVGGDGTAEGIACALREAVERLAARNSKHR